MTMRMLLILVLMPLAACGPSKPLTLGEPTYPPIGYTIMCHENPEAFGCLQR